MEILCIIWPFERSFEGLKNEFSSIMFMDKKFPLFKIHNNATYEFFCAIEKNETTQRCLNVFFEDLSTTPTKERQWCISCQWPSEKVIRRKVRGRSMYPIPSQLRSNEGEAKKGEMWGCEGRWKRFAPCNSYSTFFWLIFIFQINLTAWRELGLPLFNDL